MCRLCLMVMDGIGEDQVVGMIEHVELEELVVREAVWGAMYGGLFVLCIKVEVSVRCLILLAMRASVICLLKYLSTWSSRSSWFGRLPMWPSTGACFVLA